MEACEDIQADLDALAADMQDLNVQVGPAVELAGEFHRHEQAAQLLSPQRDRLFRALVTRARTVASSLGIANLPCLRRATLMLLHTSLSSTTFSVGSRVPLLS